MASPGNSRRLSPPRFASADLVRRWDIVSAPTMIVFVDGEPTIRLVGARPKGALLEALAPVL